MVGGLAALILGFSKTGVPGAGILGVTLMAYVYGGRLAVGATLPMLILADCFAVAFYRKNAEISQLRKLAPWVLSGLFVGTAFLKIVGDHPTWKDPLNPLIGAIVLVMLAITLLRKRLGDRLVPTSSTGTALTGVVAGFSTMVSNAAGPVMQIFFVATGMPKDKLMGTTALYFFIFNLAKVPLMLWLTLDNRAAPMMTWPTFQFNIVMAPLILVGVYLGKYILPIIPQKQFNDAVMILTAIAAVKLLF